MEWAKTRPAPDIDLAGSNILACSIDDLPDAREAVRSAAPTTTATGRSWTPSRPATGSIPIA
jgi:hypothetical protein